MDGGLLLAPNDQVWSAVCGQEEGGKIVGMVGKVHCDLLMDTPVGTSELVEQFQYCIVALL